MNQQFVIRVKQCDQKNVLSGLGGVVFQAAYSPTDKNQLWYVEFNQYPDESDDMTAGYSIINVGTGLAAQYSGDENQIKLAPNVFGDKTFVWRFDPVGDGFYAINRWDRNEVMDVRGNSCNPGTPILTYPWNGGDNQRWNFQPL